MYIYMYMYIHTYMYIWSSVDPVLDIKRTGLNIGLFVFTIAGWKGIWYRPRV